MEKELPNSEILLIYEAKMCNPNGDPDAENRPRIDPKTNINFVSDVRLKRFFRDYIVEKFGEDYVYVTKIAGESVRADTRVEKLLGTIDEKRIYEVLNKCIDARLFGATIPIGKGDTEKGAAKSFTGPVQFTWGLSLHRVELVDSSAITSVFSGREVAEKYGTMGRDWRVYYSLIGFYGVVSGRRAKGTAMTEDDLKVLDNLLWKALQIQPTTRSKIGERPHIYLRIEYKDAETVLGDLRRFVKATPKSDVVRDLKDLDLKFDELADNLKRNSDRISKIYIMTSDELSPVKELIKDRCCEKFCTLPHELTDAELNAIVKKA
ncbi:MAG: type I-B CRISPR-associated protein Cas7/Csh2 [Candidatus Bathyarchaeia archaeon]